MHQILRTTAIYLFLLLVFRLSGRRTLARITTFDLMMLLVIGEATQNLMLSADYSITYAWIVILTLGALDDNLALGKHDSSIFDSVSEGAPVVLVRHGEPIRAHLKGTHVDEEDILEPARQSQGLERMEQIKYAVLERSGHISIIPW